jgi:pimeloyl-ACP methyl ester carboxylesterase
MGEKKTFLYDGAKINYYEMGKGDPIIMLHGFGGSSWCWHIISKYLAGKNKLFLFDLKGFGSSDKPLDDKYSVSDQADIISDFIQKNGLRNLILIGHSLGGAIALLTCLNNLMEEKNDSVKGLILIGSPAYKQRLPEFTKLLKIPVLNELLLVFLPSHFSTKMVLKKLFFDAKKITPEIIENYSGFLDSPGSYHALISTAEQIIPRNINWLTSKYKDIKIPVLLVWGQNDKTIPLSIGQRLEKDLPNAKLVIIPECGHMVPEEKPEELSKLISDFLDNLKI